MKTKMFLSFLNKKNFIILSAILTLVFILSACGGGGGGGGGAATGDPETPSSTSTTTSSTEDSSSSNTQAPITSQPASTSQEQLSQSDEPSVPVIAKSSAADITSFKFEQLINSEALSEIYPRELTGTPYVATAEILVSYPDNTMADTPALTPTIEYSEGAIISRTTGDNFFDDANPVRYTVKAEDGTEKIWTVKMNPVSGTTHSIIYQPAGIEQPNAATFCEETRFNLDTSMSLTKYKNYYFDGWYENEDFSGSPVTGWGAGEKTDDVTLYAKLCPAPFVDTQNKRIYANGHNLDVESSTSIFFYDKYDSSRISLSAINEDYTDFTGYTIIAGTANNSDSTNIHYEVNSSNITVTGGRFANIYGSNAGEDTPLLSGSNLYLSGNPEIGNKTNSGVWLKTFSNNIVKINSTLSSSREALTLIAAGAAYEGLEVAQAEGGYYANPDMFHLLTSFCSASLGLKTPDSGATVVAEGGISLPVEPAWDSSGAFFTLGADHINSNGSIFSVYLGNDGETEDEVCGWFTLPGTTMENAVFDMAIPAGDGDNEYLEENEVTSDTHLQYVQFKSQNCDLTAETASEFLSGIRFYVQSGKSVTVNVNMQTIPWDIINDSSRKVTYFKGSFYEVIETKDNNGNDKTIRWDKAYTEAKKKSFNNLKGYLMTITSKVENMFIFDRVYNENNIPVSKARGWIGATRSIGTPDADSWTHTDNCFNDYWIWACGPEAGNKFWNIAQGNGGAIAGKFAAWDNLDCRWINKTWSHSVTVKPTNPKTGEGRGPMHPEDSKYWPEGGTESKNKWYVDWAEPNNKDDKEGFAQYLGVYSWNDQKVNPSGEKAPVSYIVEYSVYGCQTPEYRVLSADRSYSR